MANYLTILTALVYAGSFGFYVGDLRGLRGGLGRVATFLLACGIFLHYLVLLQRSRWVHAVPYQDLSGSMSLFGWLLAVTYLGLELIHRQRSVGAFVLPCVLLLFISANLFPAAVPPPAPARGSLFALHVTLSILAYSAFAISFVLSLMFLVQDRVLRGRSLGPVFWRFPALELLERMSRTSVLVGLGSMALGIVFGFMSVARTTSNFWNADAKNIVTLVIFGVYAAYLLLARSAAWRGARASTLCVVNFAIVILSYTVVNVYLSRYHRYF
jgi:ABC-type uncharacterized transport system permease subunit